MLTLKKVRIENGCQHADIQYDFNTPGMVGVCGPNASGKTNLLQLTAYAITGIVDKSWGSQTSLSKDGTKGGFAEVILQESSTGDLLRVRRYFTTGAKYPDSLWRGDISEQAAPIKVGRKLVDEYLEVLYGISCKLLNQVMWIRQMDLTWLLTASSTVVDSFLKETFDCTKVTKIREDLLQVSNQIVVYRDETAELHAAMTEKSVHEARIADLTASEASAKSAVEEAEARWRSVVSSLEGTVDAGFKAARVDKAKRELAGIQKAMLDSEVSMRELEKIQPPMTLTEEHAKFEQYYVALRDITVPATSREIDRLQGVINNCKSAIATSESAVTSAESMIATATAQVSSHAGDTTCALCRRAIEDASEYVKGLGSLLTDPVQLAALEQRRNNALQAKQERQTLLAQTQTELDAAIKEKAKAEAYLVEGAAAFKAIQEARQQEQQYKVGVSRLVMLRADVVSRQAMEETAKANLAAAEALVVSDSESAAAVASAKAAWDGAKQRLSEVSADLTRSRTVVETTTKTITAIEERQAAGNNSQEWYNTVIKLREYAHNDKVPKRYLSDKITGLNRRMEYYCRLANLPFTILLDEEAHVFGYTVYRGDQEAVFGSSRLSGGEKSIASTIVQLAVIDVISPDVGVVMLDEPDAALFGENKLKMVQMLQAIQDVFAVSGSIVLMPTHDDDVKDCCQSLLDITAFRR